MRDPEEAMTVAGVVVTCRPERLEAVRRALGTVAGVDVHHADDRGRLVVTIEARTTDENARRLREVQALPEVLCADLVQHYVEEEPPAGAGARRGTTAGTA